MRRGDLVTVVAPGDLGKPRPALIVQSDQFHATATVTVLLLSTTRIDAPLTRLSVEPTTSNDLQRLSQIMIDKIVTLKRNKLGEYIGRLDDDTMIAVERSLALFLGFG